MEIFQTVAIILGLTALFGFLNERVLGLQQTVGLMVIALAFTLVLAVLNAFGITSLFVQEQAFVSRLKLDESLLNGVLCFILFAGSINVKARALGEEKWVILSLAIGATLIAAILTGVALWALLAAFGAGLGLIYALVFGALISPTDPIAALAILGKVGLPKPLEAIINGESLFNDGVGVVIFTIFLTIASGTQQPTTADALIMFLREVLGGVGLGLVASVVMHVLLVRMKDYGTQVLISLAVVALAYGAAELMEVSGPIATVVLGLVIGNYSMPRLAADERRPFETFWRAVDEVLNAMLFVLIGLHVALVQLFIPDWPVSATSAILVCLAARWISVYLPLSALGALGALQADRVGLTNLLTWGGLRGGLAVAMALSLPESPEKGLILHMTYGVVVFSLVVQGLSIGRIFKADHLKQLLKPAS
ncbi:MAG: sodium:proton antiporter [Rhodospirillales bacterium]|nr:sodium:proton antiporter [Rhodospirillales bacterium]